jgi:O-antigen/teichoic acid export membrane protein
MAMTSLRDKASVDRDGARDESEVERAREEPPVGDRGRKGERFRSLIGIGRSNRRLRLASIAVFDQGIVSATAFVSGLILARATSKEEYGTYVVVISLILFLNLFQSGLITRPMVVIGATKPPLQWGVYVRSLSLVQILLGAVLVGVVAVGGVVAAWTNEGATFSSAMWSLAAGLMFIQGQEFIRRALLTRGALTRVLCVDVVWCGTQIGLLALASVSGRLSASTVLGAMGVGAAFGAVTGLLLARSDFGTGPTNVRAALGESWRFGRWTLGVNFVSYGLIQVNILIAAAFLGLQGPAILDAARNLVAPTQLLLMAVSNVLPSLGARRLQLGGAEDFRRMVRGIAAGVGAVALAIGIAVAWNAEFLLGHVYGPQYRGYGPVVYGYAAGAVLWNTSGVYLVGLEALNRPSWSCVLMAVTGVLGTVLVTVSVQRWGLYGLVFAGLAVDAMRCTGSVALFERAIRRRTSTLEMVTS